jgi:hypothetical protein
MSKFGVWRTAMGGRNGVLLLYLRGETDRKAGETGFKYGSI